MTDIFNQLRAPTLILPCRPKSADGVACPKCRWTGKEAGEGWTTSVWVSPADAARYNIKDEKGKPVSECIMVNCSRCKYRWHEEVATPEAAEVPS